MELLQIRQKPGVFCDGKCKNIYHASCAKIPPDMLKFINVPEFSWVCNKCQCEDNLFDKDADSNYSNIGALDFSHKFLMKVEAIFNKIKE